ncbi:MAG: TonB family protein [Acidobacteriota bacterium]
MDVVSEVLSARASDGGLQRMLGASLLAHAVALALLLLAPSFWLGDRVAGEPENIMTISLGGAPGPRAGGMTPVGARPIQQAVPVEAKKAIEPVRPPARPAPEMIEPKKAAPKRVERPAPAAQEPRGRTPTTGPEVQKGQAVAETSARGQGFGLSTGGGGTAGYLDTANFCCPEYLTTMLDLINRRWDSKQQAAGSTVVRFVIERDGTIRDVEVEKTSGYATLDLLAQRALLLTRRLPALPQAFTEPSLTVHLIFEYQR